MLNNLENLIRAGKISSVNTANMTARVTFHDKPDVNGRPLISAPLKYLNNTLWLPEIGQNVLCIFLPNGKGDGVIIGGI